MELEVSLRIHNIAYFPPCLGRNDGEAGRGKIVYPQPDNLDIA